MRYVVVGGGMMGRLHAGVIRDLGLELTIVEPDPQLRAELAAGFDCQLVADLSELDGPIDAASICTPDDLRMPVVEPLLSAGTALLIEKPLATSTVEARSMIDACQRDDQIMVGQIMRFDPRVLQVHQAAHASEFADLWSGRVWRCSNVGTGERISPRTSVAWFLGVHDVDLVRFVTGQEVVAVQATGRSVLSARHDVVRGELTLSGGAAIGFEWSWIWPKNFPAVVTAGIELISAQGAITADLGHNSVATVTEQPPGQRQLDVFHWPEEPDGRQGGDIRTEVTRFVEAVRGSLPMPVSAADGMATVQVIEAVERSCELDGARISITAEGAAA